MSEGGRTLVGALDSVMSLSRARVLLGLACAVGLLLSVGAGAARAMSICGISGVPTSSTGSVTCTFSYTGAEQDWMVPDGVTSGTFDVLGASGAGAPAEDSAGGLGGEAAASLSLTPGSTIALFVGGQGEDDTGVSTAGGFNGGGAGDGNPLSSGGGGGGASDVRIGGVDLSDRVLVAGGGGGGSDTENATLDCGGYGGAGGGLTGGSGQAEGDVCTPGGAGGNQDGTSGSGELGIGGDAPANTVGGGGGGGYYGGAGGGYVTGGGGGSGYGPASTTFQSGVHAGNGQISVSFASPTDPTSLALACSPASGLVTQPMTCTATVTDTSSSPSTPADLVSFARSGSGSFGGNPCTLSGSGATASCSTTLTPGAAGAQTITASYTGDGTHAGSTNTTGVSAQYPPITTPHLYVAELCPLFIFTPCSGALAETDLDGTVVNANVASVAPDPFGVAVDSQHVYWTAYPKQIGRANLDGSSATDAFGGSLPPPAQLAVDGQYVYYASATSTDAYIGRESLDGSVNDPTFINIGPDFPAGIAVDAEHVYWVTPGTGSIGRANLDGSDPDTAFITSLPTGGNFGGDQGYASPSGLAVFGGYLYWTESLGQPGQDILGAIGRADTDGSGVDREFITGMFSGDGVAVDAQHIYWTDAFQGVWSANRDGSGAAPLFTPAIPDAHGIAVSLASPAAQISSPGSAQSYSVNQSVPTSFSCVDGSNAPGVASCDDSNGTNTVAGGQGTLDTSTPGAFTYTVTATSQDGQAQSTTLSYAVTQAPAITGATAITTALGSPLSFTVDTSGYPVPSLTLKGFLPKGLSFVDNGDGTATISGTPTSSGQSTPTVTATSSAGTAAQKLSITVTKAPMIYARSTMTARVGKPSAFFITSNGYPATTVTVSGSLPSGLSFISNGRRGGTIAGTPASDTAGTYPITITASNSAGSTPKSIDIVVDDAPQITSGAEATATVGQAFSFTPTTYGEPPPTITESGKLPPGLKYTASTRTLSGTPDGGTNGTYEITFTARNRLGAVSQAFTLNVSG